MSKIILEIIFVFKTFWIWISEEGKLSIAPIIEKSSALTCSKLTIESLEQGVKYVQS